MTKENTWNHRVIRITSTNPVTKEQESYLQIHEVHYENGVPKSVTVDPITVGGETPEEIKWVLGKMLFSLSKDIIPMEYFDNLALTAEEEEELDRQAELEDEQDITPIDLGGC